MADNRTELDKLHTFAAKVAKLTGQAIALSTSNGIELAHATFGPISVNEISLEQKQSETQPGQPSLDDPVADGCGAWANPLGRLKWYIGKKRRDVLRWKDNHIHRTSIGFHKDAVDELFDGNGKPEPMGGEYLTPGTESSSDEDEQPVFLYSRSGFRVLVPLHAEAGIVGAAAGGTSQQLWDGTGMYFAQMQNDGTDANGNPRFNFVAYRASAPFSIGNPEAVLFSMNDILARLAALEAKV